MNRHDFGRYNGFERIVVVGKVGEGMFSTRGGGGEHGGCHFGSFFGELGGTHMGCCTEG